MAWLTVLLWAVVAADAPEKDDLSALYQRDVRKVHDERLTLNDKQVLVFRHCVRSTSTKVKAAKSDFGHAENFTNLSLPNWETPEQWCTGQGAAIMEQTSKHLEAILGADLSSSELKVISDTDQRDANTANSLLRGLADKRKTFRSVVDYIPLIFNAYAPDFGEPLCPGPSEEEETLQSQKLLQSVPMPMGVGRRLEMNQSRYMEVLEILQQLIGIGSAGKLTDLPLPEVDAAGKLVGAPAVLKTFSQSMLYAFASGIPYTNATTQQRYDLISWQYWFRQVLETPAKLVPKKACGAISVIEALLSPSEHHMLYVGHDSDLDALAHFFQISWEAPPFPGPRPTPPGSALAFAPGDHEASVKFVYEVFDGTSTPGVRVVETTPSTVDLHKTKDRILREIELYAGLSCAAACYRALEL
mmetsp:Transcript_50774/g.94936  ORF Transcript_50774/g.94936 Transcript_50774/m.94936 type:complete len:415 (-) Transcript_50774:212-1456(-)